MALEIYRKKRKFGVTAEPRGRKGSGGGRRYVIQKHDATRLHYDLRLELDGVMKSWAVTRGPSLDPNDKRLAVHVEDHPIEYNSFEGTIPEGEYGGGTVMIWDRGTWTPDGDPHRGYAKGHLDFELEGEKLRGRWHLVRMRRRPGEKHDNWLLIKGKDEESRTGRNADILEAEPLSVATGRTMEEIAAGKGKKRVWHSNRKAGSQPDGEADTKSEKRPADARAQTQRDFKAELRAAADANTKVSSRRGSKAGEKTAAKKSPRATPARASAKPAVAAIARKRSGESPRSAKSRKLPDFVPPSLATLRDTAPNGAQWIHEIKFDGYRIEARLDKALDRGKVKLLTRKGLDWANRFERIADAVAALPAQSALLDGELVVEDEKGVSNFSLLQTDLKEGRGDRFVYWVFDLLYLDGRDLTAAPLAERKAVLARLLKTQRRNGPRRYAEHFEGNGPAIFKSACDMNLEGIISKLRDAPYRPGRSENFIKTKCHNAQEFVVAGFSPSNAAPKAVGALTVAFHEAGKLRYAGRVGTGFTQATARDLWRRLEPLRVDRPPVTLPPDERRKNVIWVRPVVVVETEYRGITHDGLLRQAAYKGLREDKPAREVVREMAEPEPEPMAAARREPVRKSPVAGSAKSSPARSGNKDAAIAGVRLTHPDRVYWPDAGVTKRDLAEYYVSVWERMAPDIVGRPLAVLRAPDGIGGETFFQKHIASTIKQSRLRRVVDAKEHDVIAAENLGDLIALVQSGALEVHTRGARLGRLEICDRIVFDLDPGEGVSWRRIVDGAEEIRDRLKAFKLTSFVKLTGGHGIHVVAPIGGVDWDTAKNFAAGIANALAADSPNLYLAKMTKALRHDKIFIDYLRNSREAITVAAYSTRARPGAPVALPVTWQALARTRAGNQFTVLNAAKNLKADDPWADMNKVKQKLPDAPKRRR